MFFAVAYYFVVPLAPDFGHAFEDLGRVNPWLLVIGLGLEMMALYCYAPLMQAALGQPGAHLSAGRLFRIQMSTRSLSSIVPGGSAASSALGYRLMTLSGVTGARRRVRAGDGRTRVGGRAQPDPVGRAAGVDPDPRRQPAVRHGGDDRRDRDAASAPRSCSG